MWIIFGFTNGFGLVYSTLFLRLSHFSFCFSLALEKPFVYISFLRLNLNTFLRSLFKLRGLQKNGLEFDKPRVQKVHSLNYIEIKGNYSLNILDVYLNQNMQGKNIHARISLPMWLGLAIMMKFWFMLYVKFLQFPCAFVFFFSQHIFLGFIVLFCSKFLNRGYKIEEIRLAFNLDNE